MDWTSFKETMKFFRAAASQAVVSNGFFFVILFFVLGILLGAWLW